MYNSDDEEETGGLSNHIKGMEDPVEEDGQPRRTVNFGWVDNKPLGGRRAAKEKEKRKIKPGAFGAAFLAFSLFGKECCRPALSTAFAFRPA